MKSNTYSKRKKVHKSFILDTNVILHDASSITQFREHDVIIPLTVIEELDHFKRGNQVINLNAREFARTLDTMTGTALFNGGIPMGKGKGKVRIAISKGLSPEIKDIFKEDTPDNRILTIALDYSKKTKDSTVILVTKDVNLRMKAKALGILAEDYTTDRVGNLEELYSGKEVVENFDDDTIIKLFQLPFELPAKNVLKLFKDEPQPNKYYILRNTGRSVLAYLDQDMDLLKKVDKNIIYGIKPRNAEQTFAVDALTNANIPIVTLTGKAGTGKTLLALASALHIRKN
jgi:PhoH-like ATPase